MVFAEHCRLLLQKSFGLYCFYASNHNDHERSFMKVSFQWIFSDGIEYFLKEIPGYLLGFFCGQLRINTHNYGEYVDQIVSYYSLFDSVSTDICIHEKSTFEDIINGYLSMMRINEKDFYDMNFPIAIITANECINIDDRNITVKSVLKNYDCGSILRVCFILSTLQGDVFRENGVVYYMHSNEKTSHNIPHVHVSKPGEFDIYVSLLDYRLLSGQISEKKLKDIIHTINKKQQVLIDHWNTKTNGITINEDFTLKYC